MQLRDDVGADDVLDADARRVGLALLQQRGHGAALGFGEGLVALLHHAQTRDGELELDFDFGLKGGWERGVVSGREGGMLVSGGEGGGWDWGVCVCLSLMVDVGGGGLTYHECGGGGRHLDDWGWWWWLVRSRLRDG